MSVIVFIRCGIKQRIGTVSEKYTDAQCAIQHRGDTNMYWPRMHGQADDLSIDRSISRDCPMGNPAF